MTDLPEVKLKALVNFPARAVGRTAMTVTNDSGTFYLDLDYKDIQITPTVSAGDMPNAYNLIWDEVKQTFAKVPFALQATSGVASLGDETGALDLGSALRMNGNTLELNPPGLTLDASLQAIGDELAVDTIDLSGTVSTVVYTQPGTGAVASPLIRRLNNTLFASEFGAVGDNTTNDYAALQAFLNAIASSGKEGRIDSGKQYYVSGADLQITNGPGHNGFTLFGYGAQLRTDPTQFGRVGLTINRPGFETPTKKDEGRITLIEGLSFNAFQNPSEQYGISGSAVGNIVLRNLSFTSGANDGGTPPNGNYAAINFKQGDPTDADTGCFWIEIENCRFKGGVTGMPNAIWLEGSVNSVSITKNNIANVDTGVRLLAADRTGPTTATAATIPNSVRISDNAFEGCLDGIKFNGLSGLSRVVGLRIFNNRIEQVPLSGGTAFFNYNGLDLASEDPPVLGFNYVSSESTAHYIANSNSLTIHQVSLV